MNNSFHRMNIQVEHVYSDWEVRAIVKEIHGADHDPFVRGMSRLEYFCGKLLHHVTYILGHRNLRFDIKITDVEEEERQA